jgi:hypothetical protein
MNIDTIVKPPVVTDAERPHHPFSPSSLQSREACACYRNRNSTHVAAIRGTLQHKVVETGEDDASLGDDEALAAADCLDYYERQKQLLEEARTRAERALIAATQAAGAKTYIPPLPVLDLKEEYLPVDDCDFEDIINTVKVITKSTTAGYVDRALIAHDRKYAILLDWKFGMWVVEEADNNLQGISYALGLFKKYPTLEEIKFVFKQPHLDLLTEHTFKRADIPKLYLRVQTVVARAREAYYRVEKDDYSMATPMVPACNFCALIGKCPKVANFACNVGAKFHPLEIPSDISPTGIKSGADTVLGLRLAQVMAVWAGAYKTQVTDRVIRQAGADGELIAPPGYVVQSRADREIADASKFKEVTLRFLKQEELDPLATYTFGRIEEKIKDNAPRGSKTSTVEQYQTELTNSGAVKKGESYSFLRPVNVTKKKSEKVPADE